MEHSRYRKVFITGAAGFVGRALMDAYRSLGVEALGVDTRAAPEGAVYPGDVTHPEGWQSHLQGCDLLIHTAAIVTNNVSHEAAWRVNVLGTRRVLDAARQAGVRRFVHFSSLAAMRFIHEDRADESAPVMPTGNPYVDTKIASEHAVLAAHAAGEIEAVIVRPADIYGPNSRPWTIVPLEMIRKGLFFLPAHGKGLFRPIYIDDLVRGVMLAAESEAAAGHIILLGGEQGVPCDEFFGHYYRMLGKGKPPVMGTAPAILLAELGRLLFTLLGRRTELGRGAIEMLSKKTTVSNEKARRLLGWEPQISVEEGMRRIEAWL
ncbi:MAG: NAD-dependent epimerase/dehydratase family protein, partial [Anaerolineae bacterium]